MKGCYPINIQEFFMSITFFSKGAAGEVTGSKHFFSVDDKKVLIDCGAYQGRREESDRKNREWDFNASELSAVVLTHAHYDHSGLLPLLPKKKYYGNIYSTSATRDLANLILMDSAKIQAGDAMFLSKRAAKRGEKFDWQPLYKDIDVVEVMNQFVTIAYNRPQIVADGIEARFIDAGHILGSSLVHFTVKDGDKTTRILFSGDVGRKDEPILKDPQPAPPAEYIIMESTYGDRLHGPKDSLMEDLAKVINDTVERGGNIIIPSFAVGRTQEIIFYLHLLRDRNLIPPVPVFVDSPMAVNATAIYKLHQECYDEETHEAFTVHHKNPFGFNEVRYTDSAEESKEINTFGKSCIIISASGMCESGRILHHLINNIGDPKNTLLLVGYMAEYTLGRKIRDGQSPVKIFGDMYEVKAQIKELKSLSGHADYQELLEYLRSMDLSALKKIFLVHGDPDALKTFKAFLKENGFPKVEIVEKNKKYVLD